MCVVVEPSALPTHGNAKCDRLLLFGILRVSRLDGGSHKPAGSHPQSLVSRLRVTPTLTLHRCFRQPVFKKCTAIADGDCVPSASARRCRFLWLIAACEYGRVPTQVMLRIH